MFHLLKIENDPDDFGKGASEQSEEMRPFFTSANTLLTLVFQLDVMEQFEVIENESISRKRYPFSNKSFISFLIFASKPPTLQRSKGKMYSYSYRSHHYYSKGGISQSLDWLMLEKISLLVWTMQINQRVAQQLKNIYRFAAFFPLSLPLCLFDNFLHSFLFSASLFPFFLHFSWSLHY